MDASLDEAECERSDLAAAVLPGGLEQRGDRMQLEALAADPRTKDLPAVCWRASTGNMTLASEVAEVGLGLRALSISQVPATPDLSQLPEGISPERLPSTAVASDGGALLLVAAGLMGQAGALVVVRK